MKTVIIIDEHELIRTGLEAILKDKWQAAGKAATLEEAKAILKNITRIPDIIISDLKQAEEWGIEIIGGKTSEKDTLPPILVYSAYDDYNHVNHAVRSGAKGYVCKSQSIAELIAAMEEVSSGKTSFPQEMNQRIAETASKTLKLNQREQKIFNMVQLGKNNKEIAATLNYATSTIENNLRIIYQKTGVKNRQELEKL